MAEIVRWWCQLFGYADCHAAFTFESILLVGAALEPSWQPRSSL